jgi:IS5 family transposase
VEYVFRVLICQFDFAKVRYRGLVKNANHLFVAFVLVNLVLAKRLLMRQARA